MPTTTTIVELDDDLRDLMRELTGFAGDQLEDAARGATGTAGLDEVARKLAYVRALWAAVETGVVAPEYLADIVRAVREERDYNAEQLPRECDHLQTFVVRDDPDLRYDDDRAETLSSYRDQIARQRRNLELCDRFLSLVA